jgi:[FeFe] hydrogenase H-cluster maturation GTPase HydF
MAKGREKKPHIGIFGRRNSGKSTLINLLAGQEVAIVSEHAGTTTDPVKKSIEIKGIGASVIIDTAGIDDVGEIGRKRIAKTKQVMKQIDMAIVLFTANHFGPFEKEIIEMLDDLGLPFILVHNKNDIEALGKVLANELLNTYQRPVLDTSALVEGQSAPIFRAIKKHLPASAYIQPSLMGDLLGYGDIVLLIVPIDEEAPEGRLILPQVQAIRDILDNDCVAVVLKEREVDAFLRKTQIKPKLVVTDSSIFLKADASIPKDIPLTGFSILLARYKGEFDAYLKGTPRIAELKDGDRVLMLESCTHQVSCDDIGRVKIPRWITNFTGKKIDFDVVAGLDELKRPVTDYAMIIQCGGCMVTQRQLKNRLKLAIERGIPVTNYGMAIAYVQGIYERAVAPFIKIEIDNEDYL